MYGSFKEYYNEFLKWWVDGDGMRLFQSIAVTGGSMLVDNIVSLLVSTPTSSTHAQASGSQGNNAVVVGGGWVMMDV